eukprot:COSAG02_NODE_28292_length_592_cov_0.943205_1_plen_56_part_10
MASAGADGSVDVVTEMVDTQLSSWPANLAASETRTETTEAAAVSLAPCSALCLPVP